MKLRSDSHTSNVLLTHINVATILSNASCCVEGSVHDVDKQQQQALESALYVSMLYYGCTCDHAVWNMNFTRTIDKHNSFSYNCTIAEIKCVAQTHS
jgi:hypothetical protein